MKLYVELEADVVSALEGIINKIKEEHHIKKEAIRDDVFSILQECNCRVLYYPLDDEIEEDAEDGCSGFHFEKIVKGKKEHFIYINTSDTRERQAFTAAHELGHMWKVDKQIQDMFPERGYNNEDIINRFAAELLMPRGLFAKEIINYLTKIKYQGTTMKHSTMLGMIAYLMNEFFVPFKSVVFRFLELNCIDEKTAGVILEYKNGIRLQEIIKTEQYTRLGIRNRLKSIDNLSEYLQIAEENDIISQNKAENIRKDFGLTNTVDEPEESYLWEIPEEK